jgi:hypothetical protein
MIAAILSVSSSGTALAKADAYGIGVSSCSQYLSERSSNRDVEYLYFSWAQGYITRLNAYEAKLRGLDRMNLMPSGFGVDKQMSWINSYCATHGSTLYADAALELYRQIRGANGYTS